MRLKQGDMNSATVFSDDPVAMAKHWAAEGARRLHVVDLNGAIAGRPKNEKVMGMIERSGQGGDQVRRAASAIGRRSRAISMRASP